MSDVDSVMVQFTNDKVNIEGGQKPQSQKNDHERMEPHPGKCKYVC